MADKLFVLFVLVSAEDFYQGCIYGTIKALERQKFAMIINFITYYVIVTPVGAYLAFYVDRKQFYDMFSFRSSADSGLQGTSKNLELKNMVGIDGLWIGFLLGLAHQIIAYLILACVTDWN